MRQLIANVTTDAYKNIFYNSFPNLSHQELKGALGLHNACDSINALFETTLAVSNKDFLLKVSDLRVPVTDNSIISSKSLSCGNVCLLSNSIYGGKAAPSPT